MLTLRVSIPRAAAPAPAGDAPVRRRALVPQPVVLGRALLERVRAVPGVDAVALGTDLPLDGNGGAPSSTQPRDMPPVNAQNVPRAYFHRVSPDFFSTLRIPIVAGRTFNEAELTADVAGGHRQRARRQAVLARAGSDRQARQVRAVDVAEPMAVRSSASSAR